MSIPKTDVRLGALLRRRYKDGTIAQRLVLSDADRRRPGVEEADTVSYRVLAGRGTGTEHAMTRAAAARWADSVTFPSTPTPTRSTP